MRSKPTKLYKAIIIPILSFEHCCAIKIKKSVYRKDSFCFVIKVNHFVCDFFEARFTLQNITSKLDRFTKLT